MPVFPPITAPRFHLLLGLLLGGFGCSTEPLLQLDEPSRCQDPGARAELGAFESWTSPDWQAQRSGEPGAMEAWGLVVEDFDEDGLPDIFLPHTGPNQLFMGSAGGWDEQSERLPAGPSGEKTRSASAADVDGDGDMDLYLGNIGPNRLLLNDGRGHFTDATGDQPIADGPWESLSSAWGDLDGDGDLDLYVANHYNEDARLEDPSLPNDQNSEFWGDPNGLYENLGDGRFADISERLSAMGSRAASRAGGFIDADGDGDLDLYVVNDKPQAGFVNVLLENQGGALIEQRGNGLDIPVQGMGLGIGDDNDDGVPDLLVTGWLELPLLMSAGPNSWFDSSVARGLVGDEARTLGWGLDLGDLNNDQQLDVLVAYGPVFRWDEQVAEGHIDENGMDQNRAAQPMGLFLQSDDGRFTESSESWGLEHAGAYRGFVLTDLNGDGWLDFVVRDVLGQAQVQLSRCGEASWLQVQLQAPAPNTRGIGALVEVTVGDRTLRRWIVAGSNNAASTAPAEAHFGLGEAESIDGLRVLWPDGSEAVFDGFEARRRVTVVAPEG